MDVASQQYNSLLRLHARTEMGLQDPVDYTYGNTIQARWQRYSSSEMH